jgi:hypothetical protein
MFKFSLHIFKFSWQKNTSDDNEINFKGKSKGSAWFEFEILNKKITKASTVLLIPILLS